ncbi:hypothetical protein ACFVFQ_06200 [Streptomyces sp. NPDC057743]|uniref:hypothetical protein n=1 Tax=Streptomyces sp. NPDC057743 TaxID=3346236 RepID=UPI0036B0EFC8
MDTVLPEGTPELDPLQREGVGSLFEKGLGSVEAIEGPDGMEVELLDSSVGVYPGGALLAIFVDAPALEFAEDAVREVVGELLERSELLSEWRIEKCEVELHPELAQQSLDAAEGPDAPPVDPAERAARHAEAASAEFAGLSAEEVEAMRGKVRALAPRLQSFGLESFGYRSDDDEDDDVEEPYVERADAELAAGALVYAIDILVDQLFDDAETLAEEHDNVAECDDPLWLLDQLPAQFAVHYTANFARRLLVQAVDLTARLTRPDFEHLSCVAEELILKLLLAEAEVTLDTYGLLDDGVKAAWEAFAHEVYEDFDHEWLYQPAADGIDEDPDVAHLGIAPMGIRDWFTPFNEGRSVHPYAGAEGEATT